MKLVMLIAAAMTAVMMIIHIIDERKHRKWIAEIEEKLRWKNDSSRIG